MTSRENKEPPVKTMADYAMSMEQLELWLLRRLTSKRRLCPKATSLSFIDGHVAAIVSGPLSYDPIEWVCPLLGLRPDAFNHDTEEFAAIACVLMRHNIISQTLATAPEKFAPIFLNDCNGDIDLKPWCRGFYAAMNLRLRTWAKFTTPTTEENKLLRPILFFCVDANGNDVLSPEQKDSMRNRQASKIAKEIPAVVEATRQYWMKSRFKN